MRVMVSSAPGSEAGERRVRCDVVAGLIEQRDGCGHLDDLVGDEERDAGVGVVLEREPVGEPKLDASDVELGGVDAAAGVELVGPAATCEVDLRR
jgi:hypothetical protein